MGLLLSCDWVGTSSLSSVVGLVQYGARLSTLLTDAQLERSQILTLTSTNRRLLVRTKSAVWSVMSRSCWPQRLVYLAVAFGTRCTPWLDLAAPSFRQYHFLPNHTLDLTRRFVLTMPCDGYHGPAFISAFSVHWVWRCGGLVVLYTQKGDVPHSGQPQE